eukprot:gnl/TRDRNA2_/TRDRNA2_80125_c0_seq1.p1 gnl/TRDRNA2_/TRDRNA2_80125_c0~~gnl/TRDRNA2_/TRDRNA2_80125_c0_seq1.p1  ORF type:complete len:541 (-),score=89.26 gnl/TRDRNA2_/TRDRNA2_80125_c0_seq1:115-1737(-)
MARGGRGSAAAAARAAGIDKRRDTSASTSGSFGGLSLAVSMLVLGWLGGSGALSNLIGMLMALARGRAGVVTSDSGWALDVDPQILQQLSSAPCTIPRMDAASFGKLSADWKEPVILTSPKGGCGPGRCAEAWRRDAFLERFGKLQLATSSQIGVAFFGPNSDEGHRHGWPQSVAEAVALVENATLRTLDSGGEESWDTPFAFDGSEKLLGELARRTPGWEGAGGQWWPEQFSEIVGRPIVSLGSSRAGLPFHEHEAAWLWLVHGRKQWFLLPPGSIPDGATRWKTTWQWLTGGGRREITLPSASGALEGMLQCVQEPGEVVFVPRLWQHATLNIGIALGFGGQAQPRPRTIKEIDADIDASPYVVGYHLEKFARLQRRSDTSPQEQMQVLREANKAQPENFQVWLHIVELLASFGDPETLSAQGEQVMGKLDQMLESGALSDRAASVVLGHLASGILEQQSASSHKTVIAICIVLLERAAKLDPLADFPIFYLGAAMMLVGRHAESKKYLLRCLDMKPAHEKARDMLVLVEERLGKGGM